VARACVSLPPVFYVCHRADIFVNYKGLAAEGRTTVKLLEQYSFLTLYLFLVCDVRKSPAISIHSVCSSSDAFSCNMPGLPAFTTRASPLYTLCYHLLPTHLPALPTTSCLPHAFFGGACAFCIAACLGRETTGRDVISGFSAASHISWGGGGGRWAAGNSYGSRRRTDIRFSHCAASQAEGRR
jgi:hypothetical protein